MNYDERQAQGGTPDPLAIRIAQAIQDALPGTEVILFGSRARGDHRPNSDIDIIIVTDNNSNNIATKIATKITARDTADQFRRENGITLGCDIIVTSEKEFQRNRLARQHIAGQADTQGVFMSGERLEHRYEHDDGYPAHWPETKQRLENTLEFTHHFNQMAELDQGSQRIMGFCAQQSVENAFKGWLSTHNDQGKWGHEFGTLWEGIQKHEDFSQPELRDLYEKANNLLEATSYPDPDNPEAKLNWLEQYAVTYRQGNTQHPMTQHRMTQDERPGIQEKINEAINAIIGHIHDRSNTTDDDLFTEGVKPWEL